MELTPQKCRTKTTTNTPTCGSILGLYRPSTASIFNLSVVGWWLSFAAVACLKLPLMLNEDDDARQSTYGSDAVDGLYNPQNGTLSRAVKEAGKVGRF